MDYIEMIITASESKIIARLEKLFVFFNSCGLFDYSELVMLEIVEQSMARELEKIKPYYSASYGRLETQEEAIENRGWQAERDAKNIEESLSASMKWWKIHGKYSHPVNFKDCSIIKRKKYGNDLLSLPKNGVLLPSAKIKDTGKVVASGVSKPMRGGKDKNWCIVQFDNTRYNSGERVSFYYRPSVPLKIGTGVKVVGFYIDTYTRLRANSRTLTTNAHMTYYIEDENVI